jgi:outer membrane lipoprotein SlyB
MNSKKLAIAALAAAGVLLGGCVTQGYGSADYNAWQTRNEQSVRFGVVEGVRGVKLQAGGTGTGTLVGATLGGLAGSTVGGGSTANAAGAVAGALIGGLAGQSIEKSANERQAIEITVLLDGGKYIAVTQEADVEFRVGDRVRVLSDGRTTRVAP